MAHVGKRARHVIDLVATWGVGMSLSGPSERFVIVCLPRTGSQLLVELLDSHPDIRCEGEILHEPVPLPTRFLRGRAALAARRGASAWGCKIIYHQLAWYPRTYGSPARFLRRLHSSGHRIISLARSNPLEQAISALVAIEDDRYHYHAGDGTVASPRLAVAPEALVSMLWTLEQQKREQAALVEPFAPFELVYERDLADVASHQRTVDRLCAWMGLPAGTVSSSLQRPTSAPLADRVVDYPAITRTLATTRYRDLLDGNAR